MTLHEEIATPPRILLALVLALALTLAPLTPAMAEQDIRNFEVRFTSSMCDELGNPHAEAWLQTPETSMLFAGALCVDLILDDLPHDFDWNYPVALTRHGSLLDLYYVSEQELCCARFMSDISQAVFFQLPLSSIDGTSEPTEASMRSYIENELGSTDYEFLSEEEFTDVLLDIVESMGGDEDASDSDTDASGAGGASSVPDDGGHYLPSPEAWFGSNISEAEPGFQKEFSVSSGRVLGNYYFKVFNLDLDDLPAMQGYAELLKDERFGLKFIDSFVDDYPLSQMRSTTYVFESMDGSVPTHTIIPGNATGAVVIQITEHFDDSRCTMLLNYDVAFEFIDVGDVYPEADSLTDRSGNSSSSGGGSSGSDSDSDSVFSSSDDSRKKCSYCDGTGKVDCKTCLGRGYIGEFVDVPNYDGTYRSEFSMRDCPNFNCHDGKVDCRYCDDGWVS